MTDRFLRAQERQKLLMTQVVFTREHNNLAAARAFDQADELASFRSEFTFPINADGEPLLYFAGHSLGLMPNRAREALNAECDTWGKYAVKGHFESERPWVRCHTYVADSLARLSGAKPSEVVAMNTLTVNLHLMLVSFYRPTKTRYKIIIEKNAFPSDQYAVDSQARFHGFDPDDAIVELEPKPGQPAIADDDVLEQIEAVGDELSLVMLGNCNYLSGQCFDMQAITELGHKMGALVGFNLAHGAGNILLDLHDDNVDFAVWCCYKFLNAGPGGIAAAFVHERHHGNDNIPRFEGWWGTREQDRFKMRRRIDRIPTAEAWAMSNPPIFQMAALRASLQLFDAATMPRVRAKSEQLTSYLEWLLLENASDFVEVLTPPHTLAKQTRGCTLSLRFKKDPRGMLKVLSDRGAVTDFREPDIIRVAPIPLYNSFEDVYRFSEIVAEFCSNG